MKAIKLAAVLIAAMTVTHKASADEGSVALPFIRIDQNAQSAAMGSVSLWSNSAYTAIGENHGHAMASYQKWQLTSSDFISFEAAYRIAGKYGIRAAFTNQSETPYDIIGDNGEQLSQFTPGAMKAGAGFSAAIGEHFSAGIDAYYASRTIAEGNKYGALSVDAAAMARFGSFSAAAGARSMGSKVTSVSGGSFSLPSSAFLTAGGDFHLAESHCISAAAELEYFMYGSASVSAGARYTFKEIISVMGGYHMGGIIADHASAGIGLNIKGMCLDATYLTGSGDIKGTMLFGIGYRF